MFQGSTALTIQGSIIKAEIIDPTTGSENPPEIISAGNAWKIKICWQVNGLGCLLLPGHKWKVSVKLEGWGEDVEKNIPVPAKEQEINNLVVDPNNPGQYTFTEEIDIPAQPEGLYKPAVVIQIVNRLNKPIPVAGYEELPFVQIMA